MHINNVLNTVITHVKPDDFSIMSIVSAYTVLINIYLFVHRKGSIKEKIQNSKKYTVIKSESKKQTICMIK